MEDQLETENTQSEEQLSTAAESVDIIDPSIDQTAYKKDKNCIICNVKFGKGSLAHSRKYLCKFCYRGVCFNCSKNRFHDQRCCDNCYPKQTHSNEKEPEDHTTIEQLKRKIKILEEKLEIEQININQNKEKIIEAENNCDKKDREIHELKEKIKEMGIQWENIGNGIDKSLERNSQQVDLIQNAEKEIEELNEKIILMSDEKSQLKNKLYKLEMELGEKNKENNEYMNQLKELKAQLQEYSNNSIKDYSTENEILKEQIRELQAEQECHNKDLIDALEVLRLQITNEHEENIKLREFIEQQQNTEELEELLGAEKKKVRELEEERRILQMKLDREREREREYNEEKKIEEMSTEITAEKRCKCELF